MNQIPPALGAKKVHIIGETPIVDIDKWCVVSSYNLKYIVKLANGFDDAKKAITENTILVCEDALKYDTPLRPIQTPQGLSITQDNIVAPVDIMSGDVKLRMVVTSCYPFETSEDKERYKNFIEATLHSRKEQAAAERRSRGG